MAQALSNRYPVANAPRGGSQSSRRQRPRPANQNIPGKGRPVRRRPVAANDNRRQPSPQQSFPPKPPAGLIRALRLAQKGARLSRILNPMNMVVGTALDIFIEGAIDAMSVPTSQQRLVTRGAWKVFHDCGKVGPMWSITLLGGCFQTGVLDRYNSPEEVVAADPTTESLGNWIPQGSVLADHCISWTRDEGTSVHPLPGLVPNHMPGIVPWPEGLPLPDPRIWPVGLPRPAHAPVRKPEPAYNPEARFPPKGNHVPGELRLPNRFPAGQPLPSRPPPRVKERKLQGKGLMKTLVRAMGKALSGYSELGDLVDSLHDALPESLQAKGNIYDKLIALYTHANHIDMDQAVKNMIQNEIEDRHMGRKIGKATKHMQEYNLSGGGFRGSLPL